MRVVESEKQIEQKISNLQEIVDGQKDEISKFEKSIDLTKKKERKKMYDFLTTLKSNSDQIDSISEIHRQEVEAITDSQNKEISSLKESLSMKSREIDQMEKNEDENLGKVKMQMNEHIDQMSKAQGRSANHNDEERRRLEFHKKDHKKKSPGKPVEISYDSTESGRFRGIIHYLSEECGGGNVHDEGAVEVTSSSILPEIPVTLSRGKVPDYSYTPINLVDLDNPTSCFESDLLPDSWVCYDFVDAKVKPKAYSIRAYINGNNHLQNWRIDGSNDKVHWTKLDQRRNEQSINGCGRSNTFYIDTKDKNEYYRYLRLTQDGPSTADIHCLSFSALEYFGSLFE